MLQKFDERNRDLIVNINGELVHRDKAAISPFDSAVQGGDAVWEGLRLYNGRIFKLNEHLDRLERSARAVSFAEIPPREKVIDENASSQIVAAAKRLPFWERTNEAIVEEVRRTVPGSFDATGAWLGFRGPSRIDKKSAG